MTMATTPNTRASLIARLSDSQDIQAWQEFVEIYLPLLYRLARRKGVQHADAEGLWQEVLMPCPAQFIAGSQIPPVACSETGYFASLETRF